METPVKILVVDDEMPICELMKINLELAGFSVDIANSAEEALQKHLADYALMASSLKRRMIMAEDFQQQSWTEVAITVDSKNTETAGNIANMAVPYGIYIEDYSDLVEETLQIAHIDLIDEDLLKKDRTKSIIHIYINPHENPAEAVSFVKERLDAENIPCEISLADCKAQDWVNNWKQYFHAMPIGEKLLIRPEWEKDYDANGRIILNIEPGLHSARAAIQPQRLCLENAGGICERRIYRA